MDNEQLKELATIVLNEQDEADKSNCFDYEYILKTWQDDKNYYILDGYGNIFTTELQKYKNRPDFFRSPYDWVKNRMYDTKENILKKFYTLTN